MAYSRWAGSKWYIFWTTESGNKKSDQLLAIWNCDDAKTENYDYESVKDAYDNDDWAMLEMKKIPEKKTLIQAVECWLEDINEQYGEN